MPVQAITTKEQYRKVIDESGDKLVVVDFFATWCGPCKRISPFLDQLSGEMTNTVFIKVDVDELQEVAAEEGVSAMPTFYLYKNGKKVADLVGAAQDQLQKLIKENA